MSGDWALQLLASNPSRIALHALSAYDNCGWLRDRFGVSWQIVPNDLIAMMADSDAEKAGRVAKAMMQMTKFDVAALKAAYAGTAG